MGSGGGGTRSASGAGGNAGAPSIPPLDPPIAGDGAAAQPASSSANPAAIKLKVRLLTAWDVLRGRTRGSKIKDIAGAAGRPTPVDSLNGDWTFSDYRSWRRARRAASANTRAACGFRARSRSRSADRSGAGPALRENNRDPKIPPAHRDRKHTRRRS